MAFAVARVLQLWVRMSLDSWPGGAMVAVRPVQTNTLGCTTTVPPSRQPILPRSPRHNSISHACQARTFFLHRPHYTGELAVASVRSVGIDHWVTTTRH